MNPPSHPRPSASIWKRFWSPTGLLEVVPADATADEAEAIRNRNDVWLKTYMDMYILRWGALVFCSLILAILAADDSVPGVLLVAALLVTVGAIGGLASMIRTYRRASHALAVRAAAPPT